MHLVDLRSDTVTLPSPEMRAVMSQADLGDDVFGEDPSVNRLEDVAARRLGKEDAVFLPSGTMGNLLGMLVNARRGQEVIADSLSHVLLSEAAGAATLAGVQLRTVPTAKGVLRPDEVAELIRPTNDTHQPATASFWVENTHNRHGGTIWHREDLAALALLAHEHRIAIHMDGARIFNAALASGMDVAEIASYASTVTFCLSKGLGCPVGTLFCGSAADILEARRWRKMLGGGMRQVGVLAAAGLYALENMVERLKEDHVNAKMLAEDLAQVEGVSCDPALVQTNIVFIDLVSTLAGPFARECWEQGLRIGATGTHRIRLVTHFGVGPEDVAYAVKVFKKVLRSSSQGEGAAAVPHRRTI